MKNIITGKISVGEAHPLYNKTVALYVVNDRCGYDGKQTYVKTVDKVTFTNQIAFVFKNGRMTGIKDLPDTEEYVEGWLVKEA